MKVHKVVKHFKASSKKIVGQKIVYMKHDPGRNKPFVVQVFKGSTRIAEEEFINKSAAEGWIDLNAKGAEVKDLTGNGLVRSHMIKTS